MNTQTITLDTAVDGQASYAFRVPEGCFGGVLAVPTLNAAGKISLQIYMGPPGVQPQSRQALQKDARLLPSADTNWFDIDNLVLFAENTNGDTAVAIPEFENLSDAFIRLVASTDQTPGEGSGDPEVLYFQVHFSA